MKVFYSDAYVAAAHAFDTVRKSAWVADSLSIHPITGVELAAPESASDHQLVALHTAGYVAAVRTGRPRALAESQGFRWDPGLWLSASASAGGCLEAARAALVDGAAGSLSSGLHHARRDRGAGFCTFNGVALAACAIAQERQGSVLILDLDAHCGGGTASLITGNPRVTQLDVAVNSFDHYTPAAADGTLDIVPDPSRYLDIVHTRLEAVTTKLTLVIYNAGMDPYEGCDIGGLEGLNATVLAERERLVFAWAAEHHLPIAFVLAGGYTGPCLSKDCLTALHRLTISGAVSAATAWSQPTQP